MKTASIDHLVYAINNSNPQQGESKSGAIFFLGAGMSATGNIPLASKIASDIKVEFSENPRIKEISSTENDYAKLMDALLPVERNSLIKRHIDKSKINAAHFYLANILKAGFADYILTVNFDNLMFRAATLFNFYPPTYDLAILKDLTTSNFHYRSIIHLHGHFQGLWMLNTPNEMRRVVNVIPKIFDTIKDNRPWVIIGYGGTDLVFEHLKKIGRFDNGLYWIGYRNSEPSKHIQEFLDDPDSNTFYVSGYDADSFMAELNHKLNLEEPLILEKPFSYLNSVLDGINRDSFNTKISLLNVDSNRLDIGTSNVGKAMTIFETHNHDIFYRLTNDEYYKKLDGEINNNFLKMAIDKVRLTSKKDDDIEYFNILERFKNINNNHVKSLMLAVRAQSLSESLVEEKDYSKAQSLIERIDGLIKKSHLILGLGESDNHQIKLCESAILLAELRYWDKNNPEEVKARIDYFKKALEIYDVSNFTNVVSDLYFTDKQILTCLILSKYVDETYFEKAYQVLEILENKYHANEEARIVIIHMWEVFFRFIDQDRILKKYIGEILTRFKVFLNETHITDCWSVYLIYGDILVKNAELEDLPDKKSEKLTQALENYNICIDLGGPTYNKAICYLKKGDEKLAFSVLELSFKNQEIDNTIIQRSEVWRNFLEFPPILELMNENMDMHRRQILCEVKVSTPLFFAVEGESSVRFTYEPHIY